MRHVKLTEIEAGKLGNLSYRQLLMKHHKDFDGMLLGKDANDCDVYISINKHSIVMHTHQHNGWIVVRTYYDDGTKSTQLDGMWK